MDSPRIDILLATLNGARFLEAQVDSLLAQEGVSFRIVVRDDGSTDDTPAIIERCRLVHPDLITRLDGQESLGAAGNFARLLCEARAPYAALCDQDDVWAPRKLVALLEAMRELERRHGADTPLLVHSDLSVVDEALRELQPSFWRYSGIDPSRTNLARLLLKNDVTGCASLVNLALVRLALPFPQDAILHDYWLALVAAAAGRLAAVAEPLVAYRQHEGNAIGASRYGWRSAAARLASGRAGWDMAARRRQAAALLERCGARLAPDNRAVLEGFTNLPDRGWLGRRWTLLRHGIVMPGVARNVALFFLTKLGA